jgi:hypothetical protein
MQPINQHNYEAYFLDYIEGSLSTVQEQELHLFLTKHPDLKAEVEEIKLLYLEESKPKGFNAKDKLYRNEETALLQEEHLCIAAAEEVLTAEEKSSFDEMIKERSEVLAELAYYQKSRLSVPNIAFPDKEKLKKRALPLISWKTYVSAVAAAVLAIFLINSPQVGKNYTPQNLTLQLPLENVDESSSLSSELNVRERANEHKSQKQSEKGSVQKQNLIKNHIAEHTDIKLAAMDQLPFQEVSKKPHSLPNARKIENPILLANYSETEELPTAIEFAQSLVKKEVLKNKTLTELLLSEASRLGEEKLNVQVKKTEDEKSFAINIGNFSYSRNK